jgi:hypothetical protein
MSMFVVAPTTPEAEDLARGLSILIPTLEVKPVNTGSEDVIVHSYQETLACSTLHNALTKVFTNEIVRIFRKALNSTSLINRRKL